MSDIQTVDVHATLDVPLLRDQRDALIAYQQEDGPQPSVETVDGIVNLLDHLLDVAEGHAAR